MQTTTPILVLLAASLLAASAGIRLSTLDPAYTERNLVIEADPYPSPGPQVLAAATFEHALAASDLVWLSIVQEIGKGLEGVRLTDNKLIRWAHIATDLDRLHFTVYHVIAIHLSAYSKNADASDEILARGRKVLPQAWQLPFMQGYNAYFIRGDTFASADLWEHTATIRGAPRFILSLASRARYQSGDPLGSERMLEDMLPYLKGPARGDAIIRLKAFRSEPILAAYDRGCEAYRKKFGIVPPASILSQEGYVDLPPEDLFGDPIVFDEECRARTATIKVREDEARENIGRAGPAPAYRKPMKTQ
jgi:hypothetical protein